MNDSPDVSVVMSVYNGADHLRETIDSVLAQEGVSLEFVIVNDGSTDESPEILEKSARLDCRVKVLHQENQGLTQALIRGCVEARGKYIARQDVGDVSTRERLHLQKTALDDCSDLAFVSGWAEFCGPEWEFLYLVKGTGVAVSPTSIISETEEHGVVDGPTHHGSVVFRRDHYIRAGGYRLEFYCGQDWDLWYRLAEVGKFQTLQRPLYKARLVPNSISAHSKEQQIKMGELAFKALLQRRRGQSEEGVLQQARQIQKSAKVNRSSRVQAQWLYFIGECLRRNDDKRSIRYFLMSIRAYPLSIESWMRILQLSIRFR